MQTAEQPEGWVGVGSVLASTGGQVARDLAKEQQAGTGGPWGWHLKLYLLSCRWKE